MKFIEFSIAMQKEILATAADIASPKEQGDNVPTDHEARNSEQARIYFPNSTSVAD